MAQAEPGEASTSKGAPARVQGSDPANAETAARLIRETAKWLVSSAGALGAALIASLKLSDIGGLEGGALQQGGFGFALGMCGVLVALASMAAVLVPQQISLAEVLADADLRTAAEHRDSGWLGGFHSAMELTDAFHDAQRARVTSYLAMVKAAAEDDEADYERARAENDRSQRLVEFLAPAVARLTDLAGAHKVMRRWRWAVAGFSCGFVLASLGTFLYASAAEPPAASPGAAVADRPVLVEVALTSTGSARFGERLGPRCPTSGIQAVATDGDGDATTVVISDERCEPQTLELTTKEAAVASRATVETEGD